MEHISFDFWVKSRNDKLNKMNFQAYSELTCELPLPVSEETRKILKKTLDNHTFICTGFPHSETSNIYTLSEAGLYKEIHDRVLVKDSESPFGVRVDSKNLKIEKIEDFTGEIYFGDIFIIDGEEEDFILEFKAVFLKGQLHEITLEKELKMESGPRKEAIKKLQKKIRPFIERQSKWWYKWLYRPYTHTVWALNGLVHVIVAIFLYCVSSICKFLTPLR
jgi:hypothetical protein